MQKGAVPMFTITPNKLWKYIPFAVYLVYNTIEVMLWQGL